MYTRIQPSYTANVCAYIAYIAQLYTPTLLNRVCMYVVFTYVCMYVCKHACMYVFMYVCIYVKERSLRNLCGLKKQS